MVLPVHLFLPLGASEWGKRNNSIRTGRVSETPCQSGAGGDIALGWLMTTLWDLAVGSRGDIYFSGSPAFLVLDEALGRWA